MAKHPDDSKTLDLLDQYASSLPKYANPANPTMTWTGRGRKPQWVLDWIAGGGSLGDLLVDQVEVKKEVLGVVPVQDPVKRDLEVKNRLLELSMLSAPTAVEDHQVQHGQVEPSVKRGRPSKGDKPMTAAERKRASREARRARVVEFSEDEAGIVWQLVHAQLNRLKLDQPQQSWHPNLLARHQSILDKVSLMTGIKKYTTLKK